MRKVIMRRPREHRRHFMPCITNTMSRPMHVLPITFTNRHHRTDIQKSILRTQHFVRVFHTFHAIATPSFVGRTALFILKHQLKTAGCPVPRMASALKIFFWTGSETEIDFWQHFFSGLTKTWSLGLSNYADFKSASFWMAGSPFWVVPAGHAGSCMQRAGKSVWLP